MDSGNTVLRLINAKIKYNGGEKMNNYYWNKRNVSLDKDEIAPWKLPREKHATISVLCQTRIIRTVV